MKLQTLPILLVILLIPTFTMAQLRLSRLFSDNTVLQRNQPLKIWGWADPKAKVTVAFMDGQYSGKADKSGKWMVELPAQEAGGPYTMDVVSKKEKLAVKNILIGDVWICSGQSNMEWVLENTNNAEKAIAAANDTQIRHFKIPQSASNYPEPFLAGGNWEVCDPDVAGSFTAVGYYFAQQLREKTGVPIGLINTSWGGSRIEPWMDYDMLGYQTQEAVAQKVIAEQTAQKEAFEKQLVKKLGPNFPVQDIGMEAGKPVWADPDLDDGKWESMSLPGIWEGSGWGMLDGVVWYRKTVELSAEQANRPAQLGLAMVDDQDITWINGKLVGQTNGWNEVRQYDVPKDLLLPGKNTITVRVNDTGGGGGIHGEENLLCLKIGETTIDLSGDWKYKVGQVNLYTANSSDNQKPTKLYNAMIHPIIDYGIKGAIWYQGESNANTAEDAKAYSDLFKKMITGWRALWKQGDFPFFWVQLANFMPAAEFPGESNWALLRESQHDALTLPNTGEAVIIDIGEADDIHPRNKKDVGYRLSLAARKTTYGENNLVYSGPTYKSLKKEGQKIRLQFDHTGSGLMAKNDRYGYLRGFAIAGADGEFVWAKAMIDGDEVVVWSEAIDRPVAVRYAWADNPDDANLYNREGLPASPFRTDEW